MRAAGEALLELLPDRPAIERQHLGQHPNRLVHGANRVAGYTRINDLRHRTATCWLFLRSTGVPIDGVREFDEMFTTDRPVIFAFHGATGAL